MSERYQRACERIGCASVSEPFFVKEAIEWLLDQGGVEIWHTSTGYGIGMLALERDCLPTLTDALTEAVLAVEDTE